MGNHRYIFMMFEQVGKAAPDISVGVNRKQWTAAAFVKANSGRLRPCGFSFFYCSK